MNVEIFKLKETQRVKIAREKNIKEWKIKF
jgi:hypothetical protein